MRRNILMFAASGKDGFVSHTSGYTCYHTLLTKKSATRFGSYFLPVPLLLFLRSVDRFQITLGPSVKFIVLWGQFSDPVEVSFGGVGFSIALPQDLGLE